MCIIIYKPVGVSMPSDAMLVAAHRRNPDGCGLCSPSVNYKSLDFSAFLRRAHKVRAFEPCLIHFRWATTGSVKKANCHPFYDAESGTYFMHNGVLNVHPDGDITDSEWVFRNEIASYCIGGLGTEWMREAVKDTIGASRFAFMQDGQVMLFGPWYESRGLYFSNNQLLGWA